MWVVSMSDYDMDSFDMVGSYTIGFNVVGF